MNRPIRVLSVVCLILFMALLLNATYVQFVQADSLNARNGNKRVIDEEFSRERGPILVAGEPIAESVPSGDEFRFQRKYNDTDLYAKLTGYFAYVFGRGALENSQNPILSGSDNRLFVNRVVDLLANNQPKGGSVELTIDPIAQKTAESSLSSLGKNTKGAVVALDPKTGAILAMVDKPTYNPNDLATHDLDKAQDAWDRLQDDEDQPMLNRSTQLILPPGSTFKLVTAAAAIEELGLNADSKVKGGSRLTFPGIDYTLRNSGGGNCGGDSITLTRALMVSCNVTFGDLALKVGEEKLRERAEAFGFGVDSLSGLTMNPAQFKVTGETLEKPQLAQSGVGQFEVAASPLQMALVAAGVANDGEVMKPYVVQTVRAPNLSVLERAEPERQSRAMRKSTANTLTKMMVRTVDSGTASSARISGVDVAGKTGTAQSSQDRSPYAWFVAFAPADDPKIAVAVLVEAAEGVGEVSGGRLAGPIARSVVEAVLNR